MTIRLGVDLGTTWTAAAIQDGSRVEAITLGTHTTAMPSVLAVDDGEIVAGERAERLLLSEPSCGVRECKRRLGDEAPMVVASTPYGAEALLGHLLRHTVGVAEEREGAPQEVVLTHPATWGEFKLDLMREAARVADRPEVSLLTEPQAAARHYAQLGRIGAGDVVAVYDFGGGTFDVAVVRCIGNGTEILGTPEGLERLGGIDLDQIVLAHVDAALDGRLSELDRADDDVRRAMVRLRADCTAAKEALSSDTEVAVPVGAPGLSTEVRITREEFELAVRPRLADTLGALDRAVAAAGLSTGDLAGVLLVGGSSRIPVVGEEVARHTGRPTLLDADPKLVVALGAAGGAELIVKETPEDDEDDDGEDEGDSSGNKTEAPAADEAATTPAAVGTRARLAAKAADQRARRGDKGSLGGPAVAAGLGVVAAGGVAAAGVLGTDLLGGDGDDGDDKDAADKDAAHEDAADKDAAHEDGDDAQAAAVKAADEATANAEESLDAFDDVAGANPQGTAPSGGFSSRPFAGDGGEGGTPGGSVAVAGARPTPTTIRRPAPTDERGPAQPPESRSASPPAAHPDLQSARETLLGRLDDLELPEDSDPGAVEQLRAELTDLVEGYQPIPGQTPEQAIASLRQEFERQVDDFSDDMKLDALVEAERERREQEADNEAVVAEVDAARAQIADNLASWEPPGGADPAEVEALREELAELLDRYQPVPGTSAEDAVAELRERFNDKVQDHSQDLKLDALVEEVDQDQDQSSDGSASSWLADVFDELDTIDVPEGRGTVPDGVVEMDAANDDLLGEEAMAELLDSEETLHVRPAEVDPPDVPGVSGEAADPTEGADESVVVTVPQLSGGHDRSELSWTDEDTATGQTDVWEDTTDTQDDAPAPEDDPIN